MATLIPKLSIKSDDYLTDPLDITTRYAVDTIADPKEFGRTTVTTSATSTIMASSTLHSYLYIKVVSGTNTTDSITVTIGLLAGVKIRVTEFLFLPINSLTVITAKATGGACKVEYGYWSRETA